MDNGEFARIDALKRTPVCKPKSDCHILSD